MDCPSAENWPRLAIESITEYAIFWQDAGGILQSWNPGAERIFRHRAEEVIGQHIAFLFVPEDRDRDDPAHEMAQAIEQGFAADNRWHLRADGTRFWAAGTLMPMRDEMSVARGFVKVLRDMTPEKRLEEQLRQSESEFATMCLRSPAAMAAQHAESRRFMFVNDELARLTGYWRAELMGQSPLDLRLWPTDSAATAAWDRARESDDSQSAILDLRTKAGGTRRCVAAFRLVTSGPTPMVLATFLPLDAPPHEHGRSSGDPSHGV